MNYLLLALVALALGPVILQRLQSRPALTGALDGFVLISVTGLVNLHFLAPAVEQRNLAVIACLLGGFLTLLLLEHLIRHARQRLDRWGLLLGFTGLIAHAALDGAGLATVEADGTDTTLALAVILHRLPVGIAIWWLATTVVGRRAAVAALLALMGATVLGFYFGTELGLVHETSGVLELYQALVAGALVHVAIHPGHGSSSDGRVRAEGWGALGATLLAAGLSPGPASPSSLPDRQRTSRRWACCWPGTEGVPPRLSQRRWWPSRWAPA